MIVVFYWNYLNHHQVLIADAMYELLGDNFRFIATLPRNEKELKGGIDYSTRPYCILAAEKHEDYRKALIYAESADVCVFGACSQVYAVHRAKVKPQSLSFECGERWLKRGLLNVLSPVLRQWWLNYMRYYRKANFYKLCSSAFTAQDDEKLGCYKGRHFKWAYFTSVDEDFDIEASVLDVSTSEITRLMWCGRFIILKHPELPIKMAKKLKDKGFRFILDFYGSGELEGTSKELARKLSVEDYVRFHGNIPNSEILLEMRKHSIFLFTSDRQEGWGAVANESMANGCALVASNEIGSTAYLVKDGKCGFVFNCKNIESLTEKVECLMTHPDVLKRMRVNAYRQMRDVWSPRHAAESFIQLVYDLQTGNDTSIHEGPCSKA